MAKIYTKVGDKGDTQLVGGQKVRKNTVRLHAYGTIDELNSYLGLVCVALDRAARDKAGGGVGGMNRAFDSLMKLRADLESLQHWLFDFGSLLATRTPDRERYKLPVITGEHVRWIEGRIDGASALLKPLRNFILPGGSEPAAHLHVARTIARRAERYIVAMKEEAPADSIPFINRVSDYLFVMARLCNHLLEFEETEWKKTVPPA